MQKEQNKNIGTIQQNHRQIPFQNIVNVTHKESLT
jgi:hypothetical protein